MVYTIYTFPIIQQLICNFFVNQQQKEAPNPRKEVTDWQHLLIPTSTYNEILTIIALTSGYPHVGANLEARVNVNNCAPHNVTGKMARDELHCGCQVISGLVALFCVVI